MRAPEMRDIKEMDTLITDTEGNKKGIKNKTFFYCIC